MKLIRKHLAVVISVPVVFALVAATYCHIVLPDTYTASVSMYVLTKSQDKEGSISNTGAVFVPGINGKLVVEVGLPTGTTEEQAKDALFTYVAKYKDYIEEVEKRVADNIEDLVAKEKEFLDGIAIV